MELKVCVIPIIIQISHKFIHNLCITTNTLHTHTCHIYTANSHTCTLPYTPASTVYTWLTLATMACTCWSCCTLMCLCRYVPMFTVPIVYIYTHYCSTLLCGLPLGIQLRTPCAETWRWHWCCVPPLFSAYCLSQPLSVSFLKCCISTFLPYHTEEVVKVSCHTVLMADSIWRWLSRSLN